MDKLRAADGETWDFTLPFSGREFSNPGILVVLRLFVNHHNFSAHMGVSVEKRGSAKCQVGQAAQDSAACPLVPSHPQGLF